MKHNIKLYLAFLLLTMFGCLEPEDLTTENALTGGLIDPTNTSLNYVVGNPGPYEIEFLLKQGGGENPITAVRLYKQFVHNFKDSVDVGKPKLVWLDTTLYSNEVLDRTLTTTNTGNHFEATEYMFDDFIADMEISTWDDATPVALSANDGDYTIGDKFVFRIEAVLADGRVVQQGYNVTASVSTRYAGKYKALDAEYYRIGVLTYTESDWPAETSIESVDATTYHVVEYFGAFEGNSWYFQVVGDQISYPAEGPEGAQTGNGQPFITCQTNPGDFAPLVCDANTNIVINDDVNGKDQLIMTFGYYTAGSGPRVFWQKMEKIVE